MCIETAADECQECGCSNCLPELDACNADPGCIAIRDCSAEAECGGVDCLGPCGDTIDAHGGVFGASLGLLIALGDCMNAGCPGCLPQ